MEMEQKDTLADENLMLANLDKAFQSEFIIENVKEKLESNS